MRLISTFVFLSVCLFFSDLTLAESIAEFPTEHASESGVRGDGILDVIIDPRVGSITVDTDGLEISTIVIDSEAGIFDGPNSENFDLPCEVHSGIDTQIGCVFGPFPTIPNFLNGIDELGERVIGDRPEDFDYLADLTVSYTDSRELLSGTVIIVPEPSSWSLLLLGMIVFSSWSKYAHIWRRSS